MSIVFHNKQVDRWHRCFLSLQSCWYWSSATPHRSLTISQVCKVHARVHLPFTHFLFRDTTFHLTFALFASLCQKHETRYLFTSANLWMSS